MAKLQSFFFSGAVHGKEVRDFLVKRKRRNFFRWDGPTNN